MPKKINDSNKQNATVNTPKPKSVVPGENIKSGKRPSFQAPVPPKPKG